MINYCANLVYYFFSIYFYQGFKKRIGGRGGDWLMKQHKMNNKTNLNSQSDRVNFFFLLFVFFFLSFN